MKYKIKKADGTYVQIGNDPDRTYDTWHSLTGICHYIHAHSNKAQAENWRIVRIKTVKKPSKTRQALDIALKAIKEVDTGSCTIAHAEIVVRAAIREIRQLGLDK